MNFVTEAYYHNNKLLRHYPLSYFLSETGISEAGMFHCPQAKPTQSGPINGASSKVQEARQCT